MAKKTEAAPTTAIVKEETKAIQQFDYSEYGGEGAGYEGQTAEDTSLPFIYLLQPLSPAVVSQEVEGANPAMWLNNTSKQLWDSKKNNLIVIPVFTVHEFLQWKPRDINGGFVARYGIDDLAVNEAKARSTKFGKYYIPVEGMPRFDKDQGDELQETFTVFALQCGEDPSDEMQMVVIPFKSTMIKTYKSWMSQIRAHTILGPDGKRQIPPIFSHLSRLTAYMEKKNNNVWAVPKYEPAIDKKVASSCLTPDDPRFQAAFQMYQFVKSGSAKVNYNKMEDQGGEGAAVGESDGVPTDANGKKLF